MLGDFKPERWRRSTVGANNAEIAYLDDWSTTLEIAAPGSALLTSDLYSDWDLAAQLQDWRANGPLGPGGGGQTGNPPVLEDVQPNPFTPGDPLTITGSGLIGVNTIAYLSDPSGTYALTAYPYQVHTDTEIQTSYTPYGLPPGDTCSITVIDGVGQESNAIVVDTVASGGSPPSGGGADFTLNPDPIVKGQNLDISGGTINYTNVAHVTIGSDTEDPPYIAQNHNGITLAVPGYLPSGPVTVTLADAAFATLGSVNSSIA